MGMQELPPPEKPGIQPHPTHPPVWPYQPPEPRSAVREGARLGVIIAVAVTVAILVLAFLLLASCATLVAI